MRGMTERAFSMAEKSAGNEQIEGAHYDRKNEQWQCRA
jgi:hypothetical protein